MKLFPFASVAVILLAAFVAPAPAADPDILVIRNATLLTVTQGTIENGSILIRNGKIAAVGRNLKAPEGATVIDATGRYVMPGIIDCHSHIAVDGGVNEGSIAVSSMVRIEEVLDPEDIDIYRDLAGGVTTANVLHGSANPIGGQNAVIKLRWGRDAGGLLFQGAPPGIKFALGENPKRSNFTPPPNIPRPELRWEWSARPGGSSSEEIPEARLAWDTRQERIVRVMEPGVPPREQVLLFRANLYRRQPDRPWPLRPLNPEPLEATAWTEKPARAQIEAAGGALEYALRLVERSGGEGPLSEPVTIVFRPGLP